MGPYEPSDTARHLAEYLDCPCRFFSPGIPEDSLLQAYHGVEKGIPLLVKPSESLLECLYLAAGFQDPASFSLPQVQAYRRHLLAEPLPPAQEYWDYWLQQRQRECRLDGFHWERDILGATVPAQAASRLCIPWDAAGHRTQEMLLAQIPAEHPWQVFAWLPMGGWNQCPDVIEMMTAAQDWFQRAGAVPAVLSQDALEFWLPRPASPFLAPRLALEHYIFCPDQWEPGDPATSVNSRAEGLRQADTWCFCWEGL